VKYKMGHNVSVLRTEFIELLTYCLQCFVIVGHPVYKQVTMSAPSADMICGRPLLQRRPLANKSVVY